MRGSNLRDEGVDMSRHALRRGGGRASVGQNVFGVRSASTKCGHQWVEVRNEGWKRNVTAVICDLFCDCFPHVVIDPCENSVHSLASSLAWDAAGIWGP